MLIKRINLKNDIPDNEYTSMCNKIDKQGKLRGCGNCDDKFVIVSFEDEIDFAAWMIAMAGGKVINKEVSDEH
jgi:hypothetical protein